jgi:hypothetical protein
MSERALKQLVGALTVVVLVWVISTLLQSGSGTGSIQASGRIAAFFDGMGPGSVTEIRVAHAGETVTLRLSEDEWTANGHAGDQAAIEGFLSTLGGAEIGDLTATNPENHARVGVSAGSAYTLTVVTGSGERVLLVGRSGRRFGTAYVRLPDGDEVYLLEGDLRAQLGREVDAWRDRTIVAIDTASVTALVVEQEGGGYTLQRGDSAWTFDNGGAVTGSAVSGILSELAGLMASGFLSNSDSLSAVPESASLQALTADGTVLAEVRFGAGTADRWARSSSNEALYRVSNCRVMRAAPERTAVEPES